MTKTRTIVETSSSIPTMEGAGVHLRRGFGFKNPEQHDPFLLFDDFRSDTPEHYRKGFPWHPHRGIETITYVLKGDVEHGDSLGNKGIITSGDVQWMTAGSGIIHQEMPKGDAKGSMHGFQLWLNLPAIDKMCSPRYRDVSGKDIPVVREENGAEIRVICGRIGDIAGPISGISTNPEYLDIDLPAAATFSHQVSLGYTAIAYVFGGSARFAPDSNKECGNTSLILFSDGDKVKITAGSQGVRFLMLTGKPLHEPIAWQGPIVMNTDEELRQAFDEFRNNTFLDHPQVPPL